MKLAFLTDAIYPYHHGGKETLQHERAVRLARRGHTVRIYTMHWWSQSEAAVIREGVTYHAISPKLPLYRAHGARSKLQALVFGLATLRLLWAPDFDVLDVDQFPFTPFLAARVVSRLRRRPMTATWYEVWDRDYWRRYMGWLGLLGYWLQRIAARSADFVFADSALTARRLHEWLSVDPARIRVLSPGIDSNLPPPSAGNKFPPPLGEGRVGASIDCIVIGRLLPHKHVDIFLRAIATLPGVSAVIIGRGPEKARLVALAGQLNLNDRVSFESPADRAAVLERLASARLFVLPSTREGFGVAVLEAMASGVTALLVQHPDNAALELIQPGETGLVCELNEHAMALEIRSFLDDEEGQRRMGRLARERAAAYTWDAYVDRIEGDFQNLAARQQAEPAKSPSPLAGEGRGGGSKRVA